MMNKIFGGVVAALIVVIGVMSYQIKNLEGKNTDQATAIGSLEKQVANYKSTIESQNKTIDQLEFDIKLRDDIAEANEKVQQSIRNKNKNLQNQLEALKNAKPEVKNYLSIKLPASMRSLLEQLKETRSIDRIQDEADVPALEVPDRDTEAGARNLDDRGSPQADKRLQFSPRFMQC